MLRWLVLSWGMLLRLFNYVLNCSKKEKKKKKTFQEDFHYIVFASFGRHIFPWLGVNMNENIIRNLSLTLESTTEFAADKALAAQKRS